MSSKIYRILKLFNHIISQHTKERAQKIIHLEKTGCRDFLLQLIGFELLQQPLRLLVLGRPPLQVNELLRLGLRKVALDVGDLAEQEEGGVPEHLSGCVGDGRLYLALRHWKQREGMALIIK
jgi:hypothetical protein